MKITLFAVVLIAAIAVGACSSAPNSNSTASNTGNQAAVQQQPVRPPDRTPDAVAVQEVPSAPDAPIGSIATPGDSYKTAHALRAKKDIQGLKRVMSREILEFFTEIGRVQKQPLDAVLTQLVNKEQAPTAEVRNVKVNGNHAVLEFKDEYGKWASMDFVKEDGGWKLTLPPKKPGSDKPAANQANKSASARS